MHLTPTSKKTGSKKFTYDYATKEATRVAGPWTDKDPEEPSDIKERKLWPWQQTVADWCTQEPDTRAIHIIYDPWGCSGKSWLTKYLHFHKLAYMVPATMDGKMLTRYGYTAFEAKAKALLIDIPRVTDMNKKKVFEWWGALERLKNGMAEEDRYESKTIITGPKTIILFCNQMPNKEVACFFCCCGRSRRSRASAARMYASLSEIPFG